MQSLSQQLENLHGRVCLMCLGNCAGGDDSVGMRLGEILSARNRKRLPESLGDRLRFRADEDFKIVMGGADPEKLLWSGAADGFDHLIFVDAVDFGGEAGSIVLLNSRQMTARFPQVSTHRLSLGLLAQWIETRGTTQAWLLGVQVESLAAGQELSPGVQAALAMLEELLRNRFSAEGIVC